MSDVTRFSGRVATDVALALLESLRAVDMPDEPQDFGESDLPLAFQRRLGLSSVVSDQIRRYEQRKGDGVSGDEAASLFALISRRPDAARVFAEAGRRLAQTDLDGRRLGARITARALPQRARERLAWRRVRRLAKSVSPHGKIRLKHKPHTLVVEHCLPARAVSHGAGCSLVEGAIERVLEAYRAGGHRVRHTQCESRSEGPCLWQVEANGAAAGDANEAAAGEAKRAPDSDAGAPAEREPSGDAAPAAVSADGKPTTASDPAAASDPTPASPADPVPAAKPDPTAAAVAPNPTGADAS